MVCDGPDPPEYSPHELTPPPRHDLMMNGEESDDENDHFGYEPLAQGPEAVHSDQESDDDETTEISGSVPNDIPTIEPMDAALTREVWMAPRPEDPIQMDSERAEQVMSAMANFTLPPASIPEWAQSISEEQWKLKLNERIEKIKNNS